MPGKIFILSGPIHSGKTSFLENYFSGHYNAAGILSPVAEKERFFLDIATNEKFPMQAQEGEDYLEVGQYRFSKRAFEKAAAVIRKSFGAEWLIVDEIGPLELRGEGFFEVLQEALLIQNTSKIILVIREALVTPITERFGINAFSFVNIETGASNLF